MDFSPPYVSQPLWRNGLACWTSNSKVVGSSPTRGGVFFLILFFFLILSFFFFPFDTPNDFVRFILHSLFKKKAKKATLFPQN